MNGLEVELARVAARTLEELCYAYVMPESEIDEDETAEAAAVVAFAGPRCGRLLMKVSKDLFEAIAANMLGEDSVSEPVKRDALGEIGNVICGNVLPAVAGPMALYEMTPPVVEHPPSDIDPGQASAARVRLAFDQGWAEITLFLDDPIALDQYQDSRAHRG